jgi:uncharacterized membrane protein YgcG
MDHISASAREAVASAMSRKAVAAFLNDTLLYIVSRHWVDLCFIHIFRLHPLPDCQLKRSHLPCTPEAPSYVQARLALGVLVVCALLMRLAPSCGRSSAAAWLSSSPMSAALVGWSFGIACQRALRELRDAWPNIAYLNVACASTATAAAAALILLLRPSTVVVTVACGVSRLHEWTLSTAAGLCPRARPRRRRRRHHHPSETPNDGTHDAALNDAPTPSSTDGRRHGEPAAIRTPRGECTHSMHAPTSACAARALGADAGGDVSSGVGGDDHGVGSGGEDGGEGCSEGGGERAGGGEGWLVRVAAACVRDEPFADLWRLVASSLGYAVMMSWSLTIKQLLVDGMRGR